MGLFGKSYDWKSYLSGEEADAALALMEEIVARDRFAIGFQRPEVRKAIEERKTALQILKTKRRISESEIDLICSCLRKESVLRQQMGEGLSELMELNNLGHAFSAMKHK